MNILKTEWMKLKNYRVFQVFSVLYLLGMMLEVWIILKIYQSIIDRLGNAGDAIAEELSIFKPDTIWSTVSWGSSFLLYFPGLLFILLMTNENNFKTHRQNIIDGWNRSDFILGKIFVAVSLALVATMLNTIGIGLACYFTETSFSFNFKVFSLVFLQALNYLLFALLLSIFLRKSGVAIIIFLIYGLLIESVISNLVNYKVLKGLGHFLPLQSSDSSIIVKGMAGDGPYYGLPDLQYLLISSIAYCALYCFLVIRKYTKDDL
jgi:hypothetical protein